MTTNHSPGNPLDTFDHVVVLMLENRSFDNLLGYLYTPEELNELDQAGKLPLGKTFDGLHFNGEHCNPIPDYAKTPPGVDKICATRATDYHHPFPDPGEDYPHVNTQLYDTINPPGNNGATDSRIKKPYNLPHDSPLPCPPSMTGFIKDYISVIHSLKKKKWWQKILDFLGLNPLKFKPAATYDQYKLIMECFQPDQVNVLATLAREFAVFDHWHCDVPSQTYTNRSFWHAASANGQVNNSRMTHWILDNNEDTLFNRLKEDEWKIYTDNPVSITGIVHFQKLLGFHRTHFKSFKQFLADAESGSLPKYAFVEPRFFTPHNDQHPSSFDSEFFKPVSAGAVLLGEILINQVYNAVRTSKLRDDTLLIITHDEHGGTFDHAPPPCHATPPDGKPVPGQNGFTFDRLGVRVPMVMVSSYIKPHTIVNDTKHHTSFLRTMRRKWGTGSFTARDEGAPEFTEVFTADTPRAADEWPIIADPLLPSGFHQTDFSNAPLNYLQRVILESTAIGFKKEDVPKVRQMETVAEAMQFFQSLEGQLPGVKIEELTHTGFKSQMDWNS